MNLSDVVRSECAAARIEAGSRDDVLRKIADLAVASPALEGVDAQRIVDALRARERAGSTGVGAGIAIPHCRLDDVEEFAVGIVTTASPIEFDAPDAKPVDIFAFIVGPDRKTTEHVRLLSALSLALGVPALADGVRGAASSDGLTSLLQTHSPNHIDLMGHTERQLLHVVIQDEGKFHAILAAIASVSSADITVLDGHNPQEYLARMPLFAGLFSDGHAAFSRVVIACIDRDATNETVRRIESVTGHLDDQHSVLVTVQDVFYSSGHLDS